MKKHCYTTGIFVPARAFALAFALLALPLPSVPSTISLPHPPGPLWMFEMLFAEANADTGFPFSAFPGLNGSDNTKFVNDQLINRDELIHMTAFLEAQLQIAIQFMPTLAEFRQQQVNNCHYLGKYFAQIATAVDAKGSQAIGEEDLERLFALVTPERESGDARQKRQTNN